MREVSGELLRGYEPEDNVFGRGLGAEFQIGVTAAFPLPFGERGVEGGGGVVVGGGAGPAGTGTWLTIGIFEAPESTMGAGDGSTISTVRLTVMASEKEAAGAG